MHWAGVPTSAVSSQSLSPDAWRAWSATVRASASVRRIRIAVGLVLVLIPAAADTEVEAPAADDVDGRRHLGQQRRRTVGIAGHHLAQADALSLDRQRRHQRPALEGGFDGRPGHGVEVVVDPEPVEAQALRLARHLPHRLVLGRRRWEGDQVHLPALRNEDSEPRTHAGTVVAWMSSIPTTRAIK